MNPFDGFDALRAARSEDVKWLDPGGYKRWLDIGSGPAWRCPSCRCSNGTAATTPWPRRTPALVQRLG
ncbi:hypothetical protein ABZ464_24975 [Streptomyces sp. NPDC005820]|uniref:hypothetical protein n=1 Tax=Streptomyces sp. NPDC005820 TaxID=3157069 RepID=UPI0033C326BB